jgi:cupin superfamily acireductone dioxygenase involved in methionine salvage
MLMLMSKMMLMLMLMSNNHRKSKNRAQALETNKIELLLELYGKNTLMELHKKITYNSITDAYKKEIDNLLNL